MAGGDRKNADAVLVAALAVGATVEQAAERAGVSARTVHRRLEDADFKRRVDDVRADLLGRAMARLSAACTGAVTTLTGLLTADSESVRLGAARAILDAALRWRAESDLAARLDRVEGWLAVLGDEPADGKAERWRARA